jgi:glycosyltransferase involved in cell wall biosynthesis
MHGARGDALGLGVRDRAHAAPPATSRPRRILYLGLLPPHRGASAVWAEGLLPLLRARGHEIVAIAPVPDGVVYSDAQLESAGIVVRRYAVPYFDSDPFANTDRAFYDRQTEALLARASSLIASGWAEVLVIGNETFIPRMPELARQAAIPTIAIAHTIYWTRDQGRRDFHFGPGGVFQNLAGCDQIVCVARHAEAQLRRLGLATVTTIPNGVDLDRFSPRRGALAVEGIPEIPYEARVVSHVANLKPVKQAWRLIEAVPAILDRHPQTLVLLMGEGPCEADLRARCARLGLARHVRFLGWIERRLMPQYYCRSDVVVLPSASECAPFAYLEALACGCPVVSTPIDAARELLTDLPGGFIATSDEPADIAAAVCEALAYRGDRRRRDETAQAATRFDVRAAATRFGALIDAARCRAR